MTSPEVERAIVWLHEKRGVVCDTGPLMIPQKCRRVSQTQGIRGPDVRRLRGETVIAFTFQSETRPQGDHVSGFLFFGLGG